MQVSIDCLLLPYPTVLRCMVVGGAWSSHSLWGILNGSLHCGISGDGGGSTDEVWDMRMHCWLVTSDIYWKIISSTKRIGFFIKTDPFFDKNERDEWGTVLHSHLIFFRFSFTLSTPIPSWKIRIQWTAGTIYFFVCRARTFTVALLYTVSAACAAVTNYFITNNVTISFLLIKLSFLVASRRTKNYTRKKLII